MQVLGISPHALSFFAPVGNSWYARYSFEINTTDVINAQLESLLHNKIIHNSTLATADVVLVSVAVLQDQVKFKMGSCSSISRPSSPVRYVQPYRAPRVQTPPKAASPFPSAPPEKPTEIGRFLESGGNLRQEMIFNSANGKLEVVSNEEATRPGREVVSAMNKAGSGGFFVR